MDTGYASDIVGKGEKKQEPSSRRPEGNKFLIKYNHTLRDDFVLCFSLEVKEMKKKRFRKILPRHRHRPVSVY